MNTTCEGTSKRIYVGQEWSQHFAPVVRNISIDRSCDSSIGGAKCGVIGLETLGQPIVEHHVYKGQEIEWEFANYVVTLKVIDIISNMTNLNHMLFDLCWVSTIIPPVRCVQTFVIQDQDGNPISGNINFNNHNFGIFKEVGISFVESVPITVVVTAADADEPITRTIIPCEKDQLFVFNIENESFEIELKSEPSGAEITVS